VSRDPRQLYLDLLKQCLTFMLWDARDGSRHELRARRRFGYAVALRDVRGWQRVVRGARFSWSLVKSAWTPLNPADRAEGRDWPALAHTMVGTARLDNVQACVEDILRDRVPGDLVETGVWRGGVAIFMRAILACHGDTGRLVWVADSFAGLPRPDDHSYPADRGYDLSGIASLAVPLDEVRDNFRKYGLLDDQVEFLAGWFKDTLPAAPIERIAVLRLDGDLYESTILALEHLYPKLSPGGYVIVDDYVNSPPCQQAVNDYRAAHDIVEEIVQIDWSGVYWRKAASPRP
jgi:O-methyltransferase